ncbi:MAG: hypothetical protein HY560_11875 [Gemmatimonadetes bacterium]|nr:hypothetical protein [Gemmatimonadota bacterium]
MTPNFTLGIANDLSYKATSTWNTRFNFALTRSRILELAVPPYQLSSFQTGAFIIQTADCALRKPCTGSPTQLWGNDTLPGAAAGTIVVSPRPIGEMTPNFTLGIANDLSYKATRVYVLWDWQNGGMLAAGTWRHNDISRNAPDHDVVSPISGKKLGLERIEWYRNVTTVYFRPASFLKLREVQLTYDIPTATVRKFWSGARYVRLGVSGRNLLQFTPYRGGDPEAATFPFNSTLPGARELGAYPPSRSFWFNIDLGF